MIATRTSLRRARNPLLVIVICLAIGGTAVLVWHASNRDPQANARLRSQRSLHLAANVQGAPIGTAPITVNTDGTTFAPVAAAAEVADVMTAQQAFSVYAGPGESMADGTSYSYGTLTWPLPDGSYVYKDQPVWAYRSGACLPDLAPPVANGATASPSPAPTSCTSWLFLDAVTGKQLMGTDQN
jgi:hypothetical protein